MRPGRSPAACLLALAALVGAPRDAAPQDAAAPPAAMPVAPDPGPARVTRRDLALALRAFEQAWRAQPPEDVAVRREVAAQVSRATLAFFVGAGTTAVDGLHAATWRVEGRGPWTPQHAALARTRVRLPAVSVVPEGPTTRLDGIEPVLGSIAPVPRPWPVVRAFGVWSRPGRCGGVDRGGGTFSQFLTWDGTPTVLPSRALHSVSSDRCDGIRPLAVRLTTEGDPAVDVTVYGETCVVHGDPRPRLAGAQARLAAVPTTVAAPTGVRPTLARYVGRIANALRNEVDEILVDVPDELRRLEDGLAGLEAAARTGTAYRPGRGELAGDHHRVTASGATYRVFVPPLPQGGRPGPLPLVVALHGMGGSEDMFFEAYGAGEALRQTAARGWVLASPEDVKATVAVVEDLRALLTIDAGRVYGVGHSMGAGALWRTAMAHPDLFAAFAPIAGGWMSVGVPTWSALAATPVLAITAAHDFGRAMTERTARTAKEQGVPVELRVLPDLDHLLVVGEALPAVFAFFDGNSR